MCADEQLKDTTKSNSITPQISRVCGIKIDLSYVLGYEVTGTYVSVILNLYVWFIQLYCHYVDGVVLIALVSEFEYGELLEW